MAPSGWQAAINVVDADLKCDWLPSTALIWRADVLREVQFDEFYTGYSYLEDLDFSYGVGRTRPMYVVADARYIIAGTDGAEDRKMWSTFLTVKMADGWRIAAIRNMRPAQ